MAHGSLGRAWLLWPRMRSHGLACLSRARTRTRTPMGDGTPAEASGAWQGKGGRQRDLPLQVAAAPEHPDRPSKPPIWSQQAPNGTKPHFSVTHAVPAAGVVFSNFLHAASCLTGPCTPLPAARNAAFGLACCTGQLFRPRPLDFAPPLGCVKPAKTDRHPALALGLTTCTLRPQLCTAHAAICMPVPRWRLRGTSDRLAACMRRLEGGALCSRGLGACKEAALLACGADSRHVRKWLTEGSKAATYTNSGPAAAAG